MWLLFAVGACVPFVHVGIDCVNWACFHVFRFGDFSTAEGGEKKNSKKNIPGLTATSKALLPQDIKRL